MCEVPSYVFSLVCIVKMKVAYTMLYSPTPLQAAFTEQLTARAIRTPVFSSRRALLLS